MNYLNSNNKTVFIILLILVSSFAKALGTEMAFTKTLITLTLLFYSYTFIAKKKKEIKLAKSKQATGINSHSKKTLHIIWNVGCVLATLIIVTFYKTLIQEGQGLLFRKTFLIGFFWFAICLVTYKFARWVLQKYKISPKVIYMFGWANLISWIIGSIGLVIAILTTVFVQLIPKKQRTFFNGLAYISLFLSVCNMITGIFTTNLYYVGLVSWAIIFSYTLLAIIIYMFFVKSDKKKTKTETDLATNTLEKKHSYMIQHNKRASFLIIVTILFLIFSGLFYWFEVRPVTIRRNCSWVKTIEPFVLAQPAMAENELNEQGLLKDCSTIYYRFIQPVSNSDTCEEENKLIIEKYSKPQDEIPEKETKREATEKEYQLCLRNSGLK